MTTNNNDTRWIQRLSNYDKALERLSKAADILSTNKMLGDDVDDLLKEGLVQRFEYTQELAWKVMKDYEEFQGYTDIQGSRDAIRKALQMGIIDSKMWMETIASRNVTSHCYDETEFNEVLNLIISQYLPIFKTFAIKMNKIKEENKKNVIIEKAMIGEGAIIEDNTIIKEQDGINVISEYEVVKAQLELEGGF